MAKNNKNSKHKSKLVYYLLLIGIAFKFYRLIFRKDGLRDKFCRNVKCFIKAEKKEIKELKGGKESFGRYCKDSSSIFRDYFIPHEGNGHKPLILRPRSLLAIVVLALALKLSVTGYLFFIYPNDAQMQAQMAAEILTMINEERASGGLAPLSENKALSASALAKAEDMAIRDYFAHHSPDGKKPWDWIDRGQYAYLFVGENLAINFTSARSAHIALMNSESHKKNIISEKYKDIGLAVISGTIAGERTNILVQMFAAAQTPELKLAVTTEPAKTAGTTEPAANIPIPPAPQAPARLPEPETVPPAPVRSEPAPFKKEPVQPEIRPSENPAPRPREEPAPAVAAAETEITALTPVIMFGEGTPLADFSPFLPAGVIASPNPELQKNPNTTVMYFEPVNERKIGLAARVVKSTEYAYFALLILMTVALLLNILVRISVQHKPVILQTIFAILFLAGLLSLRVHILEEIAEKIALI